MFNLFVGICIMLVLDKILVGMFVCGEFDVVILVCDLGGMCLFLDYVDVEEVYFCKIGIFLIMYVVVLWC